MAIEKNKVVTLEYTLRDDKGNLIGSTDGGEPFSYIQGGDAIFPALQARLEGHHSGERLHLTLSPEEAYGVRDERLVMVVPHERFGSEPPRIGMAFKRRSGEEEVEVIVIAVDGEGVTIDANPPLAGVTLEFEVVITGVRDAGSEELTTGEVAQIDEIFSQQAQPSPL